MSKVTLGLLQHACGADPAVNLKKTLSLAERAARRGAKIICTQELFRSKYFCQAEDHRFFQLAEPIPGPSTDAFQTLARTHAVVVIASLFERRAAGLYHNSAVIIDADGTLLSFAADFEALVAPQDRGRAAARGRPVGRLAAPVL